MGKIVCEKCGKHYASKNSLHQHIIKCNKNSFYKKANQENDLIGKMHSFYNSQLTKLENKYRVEIDFIKEMHQREIDLLKETFEKQISYLQAELKTVNTSAMTIFRESVLSSAKSHGDISNHNSGNINFIIKNYTNAPEFTKMPCTKMNNLIKNKSNHVDILVNWYVDNILEERLAGMIIEYYVKDNPEEQSIFATDVVRYNYLIMLTNKNKRGWFTDKGGTKVNELAIQPLIDILRKTLKNHRSEILSNFTNHNDIELLEPINNIIGEIESNKLQRSVMKLISPQLAINKLIRCTQAPIISTRLLLKCTPITEHEIITFE